MLKRSINVTNHEETYKKFLKIRDSRPQDRTLGDTFDYIIGLYDYESSMKPKTAQEIIQEKTRLEQETKKP